jgi:outer membrane protein
MKKVMIFLLIAAMHGSMQGQFTPDALSYQQALALCFEHNYGLKIMRNASEVAGNNNTLGNAGFLPTISTGVDVNAASRDSRLEFFSGQEVEAEGAQSRALGAFALLNWTVFDGFTMFATKDKLAELNLLGELELRFQMEQVALALAQLYYQIVQEQQLLSVYLESVEVSQERLVIERRTFELGSSSELQTLNAEVDLNADRALILSQRMLIENLKADLNFLLGRDPSTAFTPSSSIDASKGLSFEDLTAQLGTQNTGLLAARARYTVASHEIREQKGNMLPQVGVFAEYGFNRQANEVGVLASNLTQGPNVGVTLRWNLFDGLNNRREIENRKLWFENANYEAKSVELEAKTRLVQQFNAYRFTQQLVDLEQNSLQTARKNLEVAEATYRLGGINALEFRLIQLSELEAESRMLRAQYQQKIAELSLLNLSGNAL